MSQWLTRTEIEALLGALSSSPSLDGADGAVRTPPVSEPSAERSVGAAKADQPAEDGERSVPDAWPAKPIAFERVQRAVAKWCHAMGTSPDGCSLRPLPRICRPSAGLGGDGRSAGDQEAGKPVGAGSRDDWMWFVGRCTRHGAAGADADRCCDDSPVVVWLGLSGPDAECLLRVALGLREIPEPGATAGLSAVERRAVGVAARELLREIVSALRAPGEPDSHAVARADERVIESGDAYGAEQEPPGARDDDDIECRAVDCGSAVPLPVDEGQASAVSVEIPEGRIRFLLVVQRL